MTRQSTNRDAYELLLALLILVGWATGMVIWLLYHLVKLVFG